MNTMNKYTTAVLFVTLLGLTACSSSGSSEPSITTSPTNNTPAQPNTPEQSQAPEQPKTPLVIPAATNQGSALAAPRCR